MDLRKVPTSEFRHFRPTHSLQSESREGDTGHGKIKQHVSTTPNILLAEGYRSEGPKKGIQRIVWSHELTEDERRQEDVILNLFPYKKPPPQSEPSLGGRLPRQPEAPRRRELTCEYAPPRQSKMVQKLPTFGAEALYPPIRAQMGSQCYQQMRRGTDRVRLEPPKPSRPFTRPPGRPANRTSDSTFAGCSFGNFMTTSVYEMPPPLPESYNKAYQPADVVSQVRQATTSKCNHGNRNAGSRGDKNNRGYEHEEFTSRFQCHTSIQAQFRNRRQNQFQVRPQARPQKPLVPAITNHGRTQDDHFETAPAWNGEYYGGDRYLRREHERPYSPTAYRSARLCHQSLISGPTPRTRSYDRDEESKHRHENFSDFAFAHPPRFYHFPILNSPTASIPRPASPTPASAPSLGGQKRTRDRDSVSAGDEESRRKRSRGNNRPSTASWEIDGSDKNDEKRVTRRAKVISSC